MPNVARRSRHRLPLDVRPSAYDVDLVPDLEAGRFSGEVRIAVRVERARPEIVLHAADMRVERAVALVGGEERPARAKLDAKEQRLTLRFARPLPPGDATLVLRFAAKLNEHLRGFYAVTSGGRRYAFTQCEAADARRIFPCFDEPEFKARFRVTVTVARDHHAVSNGAIEQMERCADGGCRIRFAETPPLSTYLFALAVGPLEHSSERLLGDVPIRIWHVPGKGHLCELGLEAATESLRRLQEYFGIAYPYGKLDLVAVPDFEAGAMENAGAVFFRETLLLLDPATASLAERKRAAEVIAHELAHMWYGDLVTMEWWDDLWLNEAFATWMAYRVVDDWRPEWRLWHGFEHDRAGALALDALTNTHPIYAPVRSVAEATENFDAITYEKGAAVVRMLEHFLGAESFRDGVRLYMRTHREGNAVAADLWRALEEASGRRDVARVAQAWIEQAGFPLVSFGPAKGEPDRVLQVRQERFFADPKVPAVNRRVRWPLPLVVRWRTTDGTDGLDRTLVERASATTTLGAGSRVRWYHGNAAAGGFYRVLHDPADRAALLADFDALTAVERLALANDQWALVRAGRASLDTFLDIVDALGDERDHDVLDGLGGTLGVVDEQIAEPGSAEQAGFRAWVARRFGPAFARLGWRADVDEDDDTRLRRAALLRLVGGVAEAEDVLREAREWLDRYLADRGALDANVADPVVGLAARVGDEALYDRYRTIVGEARTPQERRRFLLNLPSFRTPETIRRTLANTLEPEIPTQDVAFVFMRLFGNPAGREPAWRFFTKRWSAVRRRIPPLMISRLVETAPALRDPRYARELRAFFAAHPVPEAKRALKQALEVFRLNADLRRRAAPALARWVAGHPA